MTCLIISRGGCSKWAELCKELEKSVLFQDSVGESIDWCHILELRPEWRDNRLDGCGTG